MKPTRRLRVRGDELRAAVPSHYQSLVLPRFTRLAEVNLLFFPREEVITSTIARRAVERLVGDEKSAPWLAFVKETTVEARDFFVEAGIQVLPLREFGWTDERYHAVTGGRPH